MDFFNLSPEDAVQLYEIYSQHIIITRKLESLFILGNQLKEFTFKTPEFFVLNPQYNTRIELYIASLKSQNAKLARGRTQLITNTDMSFSRDNKDESALTTTKDLSKIIGARLINFGTLTDLSGMIEGGELYSERDKQLLNPWK